MVRVENFFNTKIEYLKGFGPKRAEVLNKELGLFTCGDLIQHYPFRHEDRSRIYHVSELDETLPYVQVIGQLVGKGIVGEGPKRRLAAVPEVEAIVEEALTEFGQWSDEMVVSPTIQKLKASLEQIRREEMARHLRRSSAQEQALVERVTRGMMQKIMKLPVLQLKAACKRGEAETLIDVLNDLFNLEGQTADSPGA